MAEVIKTATRDAYGKALVELGEKNKKVVVLGFFVNHSRNSIRRQLADMGATPMDSVSGRISYVIIGEKAGPQLLKAQKLGLTILTE